jgi:CTP synthase
VNLTKDHNITTGKVYKAVIDKERRGDFLGKTVQVVPHISNEIMDRIERVAKIPVDESNQTADVCLIEVGGTVGDIESMVFLEALRQFQFRAGRENMCFFHLSLVPTLGNSDEQKVLHTKDNIVCDWLIHVD